MTESPSLLNRVANLEHQMQAIRRDLDAISNGINMHQKMIEGLMGAVGLQIRIDPENKTYTIEEQK